jgi:hypothetical protein
MRRLAATVVVVLAAAVVPAAAAGNTIKVHNTHDHGAGSLRRALTSSDSGDTVKVPAGHYVLTSGELFLDHELKIAGAGARKTVVDANRNSRVLEINYGIPGKVRLSGLTVREGDTEALEEGGGILAGAGTKLILNRVAVLNNHAITNTDWKYGGGVYSNDEVVVKQSLFAGNHAYNGGAIWAADPIRAIDSTFFNNFGGNPTFNGDGGAFDTEVKLIDSTVVANQCFNGDTCGGGLNGADATLKGTIVADNVAYEQNGQPAGSPGNPGTPDNCGGTAIASEGHNLDDHQDCDLAGPGDISQKNPQLGKLKNNGGPTDTLALPHTSPAFNAGAAHCTAHDQRGVKRPQGPRCDIGAFELVR